MGIFGKKRKLSETEIIKPVESMSKSKDSWNDFVDWACSVDPKWSTIEHQRAFFCFWYQNEVNNGGHLQYFENRGLNEATLAINAIKAIGEYEVAKILKEAVELVKKINKPNTKSLEEYITQLMDQEFLELDKRYNEKDDSFQDSLQNYTVKLSFN